MKHIKESGDKWFNLFCIINQLTSLDVSNNTALIGLVCFDNQLSSLDVSNNTALKDLRCSSNQLISLDVSNNTHLRNLKCSNNQLSSLDISNNTILGRFNDHYGMIDISQMPSLYKVCVWELPFPPAEYKVDTTGSPNVYFTMDCN